MSDYTITTDFGAKDLLNTGDSGKVIKGAEFTTEFQAIRTAVNSKANSASPTFSGTSTLPTANITTLNLSGAAVTSSAAEINTLDGFTGSVDDLNYAKDLRASGVTAGEYGTLSGVTASTAELNLLDGATVTTAEINILSGVTADSSELNALDGATVGPLELNILDGALVSTDEVNLLDGATAGTVTNSKAVVYSDAGEVKATTLSIGSWVIKVDTNELVFVYDSTEVFKVGTDGAVTAANDITAFGTI